MFFSLFCKYDAVGGFIHFKNAFTQPNMKFYFRNGNHRVGFFTSKK